jgi:hypothetical protein
LIGAWSVQASGLLAHCDSIIETLCDA